MDKPLAESIPAWETAPSDLRLAKDEIHVWGLDRGSTANDWNKATEFLSEEEKKRAERLLREADRYQFALSRKGLRVLLASYLKRPPGAIRIESSTQGKPARPEIREKNSPVFSLSHSGRWTLYAFRKEGKVGIDVETKSKSRDDDQVASRYFSVSEAAWLRDVPDSERPRAFLSLWTLKEAYLKATGEGIARGLDKFSVEWREKEKKFVLHPPSGPSEVWQLESFSAAPGYQAGLAFDHLPCRIRFFQFRF